MDLSTIQDLLKKHFELNSSSVILIHSKPISTLTSARVSVKSNFASDMRVKQELNMAMSPTTMQKSFLVTT